MPLDGANAVERSALGRNTASSDSQWFGTGLTRALCWTKTAVTPLGAVSTSSRYPSILRDLYIRKCCPILIESGAQQNKEENRGAVKYQLILPTSCAPEYQSTTKALRSSTKPPIQRSSRSHAPPEPLLPSCVAPSVLIASKHSIRARVHRPPQGHLDVKRCQTPAPFQRGEEACPPRRVPRCRPTLQDP